MPSLWATTRGGGTAQCPACVLGLGYAILSEGRFGDGADEGSFSRFEASVFPLGVGEDRTLAA